METRVIDIPVMGYTMGELFLPQSKKLRNLRFVGDDKVVAEFEKVGSQAQDFEGARVSLITDIGAELHNKSIFEISMSRGLSEMKILKISEMVRNICYFLNFKVNLLNPGYFLNHMGFFSFDGKIKDVVLFYLEKTGEWIAEIDNCYGACRIKTIIATHS